MLLEGISHLLALDFQYFIDLFMGNLLIFFMFAAMMFFFTEGKKFIAGFFIFTMLIWGWLDLQTLSGVMILVPAFLGLNYLLKLVLLFFAENSPGLKSRLYFVNESFTITLWVVFTYLWLG